MEKGRHFFFKPQLYPKLIHSLQMCLLLFLLSLVVYACLAKAFPAVPDPLNFDVSPSLRGFDISEDQIPHFPDFWPCVHEHGFRKVAIRGWQVSLLI